MDYKTALEIIEKEKKKLENLTERRSNLLAKYEATKQLYNQLKQESTEKYGTADLNELKAMLVKLEKENEEKTLAFQKDVETLEQKIKIIEEALQGLLSDVQRTALG